jgi:hypothetical protein
MIRLTPRWRVAVGLAAVTVAAVVLMNWPARPEPIIPVPEESPFLWAGKAYADRNSGLTHWVYERYGNTPFRYPNAAACITGDPGNDGDLIDADLRWHELMTAEEVEVCLFRVFSRLGSLERIEEWLVRQGWGKPIRTNSLNFPHLDGLPEGTEILALSVHWDVGAKGAPFGSGRVKRQIERLSTIKSIHLETVETTGLRSIRLGGSGIWSK